MSDRRTLLGLAGRTASWPQRLEAWSTSGSMPLAVSYCESVAHLKARLQTERVVRPVLLDGDLSLVDRDLLADITAAGGVTLVIEGTRRHQPWTGIGAAAVLPASFDQQELLAALDPYVPVPTSDAARPRGAVIGVTGPGGTGASVAAIALAQGLADGRRRVLLADCCLHAEQAMLHNAHGSQPCLTDVVELHAERIPEPRHVRQLALGIVERGYYLLPGMPRARNWAAVRAGSLQAALRSLRAAFDVVVADVDADVEGEAEGGSIEVEERNVLARTILAEADVALVVGQPTMKGVYALVRTLIELLEFGMRPQRLVPVINQAASAPHMRAELSRAVRHLIDGAVGGPAVGPVLFLPSVGLEERLREREALPDALPELLAGAAAAVLGRGASGEHNGGSVPSRVEPGSLGHWSGGRDAR